MEVKVRNWLAGEFSLILSETASQVHVDNIHVLQKREFRSHKV